MGACLSCAGCAGCGAIHAWPAQAQWSQDGMRQGKMRMACTRQHSDSERFCFLCCPCIGRLLEVTAEQ